MKGNSALRDELRKQRIPVQPNMRVPTYWGELPFTGGPFYFGIVIVFFFILGLFLVKEPIKWWFGISTLLLCLLSLGKHFEIFNKILFDYLPYYNKFRAPSSILTIAAVLCTMFSAYTLSKLYKRELEQSGLLRGILYSGGILAGICLFFWMLGPGFFDMTRGQQTEETAILVGLRKAMMSSDSMRGLVLVLLAAAATWLYQKNTLKPGIFLAAAGVLILFDLFTINQRYIDHSDFVKPSAKSATHAPRPVDSQIMEDKAPGYRVLDNTIDAYNNSMPSYFHHMVGGYHPGKLRRYQDLIDRCIDPERSKLGSILQSFTGNPADSAFVSAMNSLQVINMLNTKYLIL